MLTSNKILRLYHNLLLHHMFEIDFSNREKVVFTLWYRIKDTLLVFDVMCPTWEEKYPKKTKIEGIIIRYQISFDDFCCLERRLDTLPVFVTEKVRRKVVK